MSPEKLIDEDWRLGELEWRRLGEITAASIFFFDDLHISGGASAGAKICRCVRILDLYVCVFIYRGVRSFSVWLGKVLTTR